MFHFFDPEIDRVVSKNEWWRGKSFKDYHPAVTVKRDEIPYWCDSRITDWECKTKVEIDMQNVYRCNFDLLIDNLVDIWNQEHPVNPIRYKIVNKDVINDMYYGGYKKRHGDICKVKAIYNGIERATGKFKTVVEWSDGTKTIVTSQNDNHLSRELAFSYAWVKKQYGSNSAFKRHVDKYVETWGYMGQIFFDDGDYQAQLSIRTKSHDIYDQVALVMTMKDFGGIDKVAEIVEEKTFNE